MKQVTVGIRELKGQLSHYVQEVKDGTIVLITERGKPVGRMIPLEESPEDRLRSLADSNLLAWSGRKLAPRASLVQVRGPKTVAEILLEERD